MKTDIPSENPDIGNDTRKDVVKDVKKDIGNDVEFWDVGIFNRDCLEIIMVFIF